MHNWQTRNPIALNLLFHEAYHHYIKSLYPCADGDVLILGGILMQCKLGDYDHKKCNKFFSQKCGACLFVCLYKSCLHSDVCVCICTFSRNKFDA